MRRSSLLLVFSLVVACQDEQPAPSPVPSSTATASASVTASASATIAPVSPACMQLNKAIWDAADLVPRACKKNAECELAGPGRCVVQGAAHSCMIAVAAGKGKPVNEASDAWKKGGCEGDLKPPPKETILCKAGTCSIEYGRTL